MRVSDVVLTALAQRVAGDQFDVGRLAQRLGMTERKMKSVLTRPHTWQLSTVSDLMRALDAELKLDYVIPESGELDVDR